LGITPQSPSSSLPILFKTMGESHLERVFEIEQLAYDYPWTKGIINDCLKTGYIGVVCIIDKQIQGYAIMLRGVDEVHLLNICIHPDFRQQKIATKLLKYMLNISIFMKANNLFLEVRKSNTQAINLYKKNGFKQIGTRKDYYRSKQGREDAITFKKDLSTLKIESILT